MSNIHSTLKVDGVVDSQVGDVNINLIIDAIQAATWFIELALNALLGIGIPLSLIFSIIGINFIDLTDTVLLPFEHYFILFATPVFNLHAEKSNAEANAFLESIWPSEVEVAPEDLKKMAASLGLNATQPLEIIDL